MRYYFPHIAVPNFSRIAVSSYSEEIPESGEATPPEGFTSVADKESLDVGFQSASATNILVGTSITATIPSDVLEGDLLLLHVMHRSALSPVDNWNVLNVTTTPIAADQVQTVLYKVAEAGDADSVVNLTQASSSQFITHIQAFRSVGDVDIVDQDIQAQVAAGLEIPSLQATRNNQIASASMTFAFALISSATNMAPPPGFTLTSVESVSQNRLGAGYKLLTNEEVLFGAFNQTNVGNDTDQTAFAAILDGKGDLIGRCSWNTVENADGYNVYVIIGGTPTKQNTELIVATSYDITGLAVGEYDAYVTSVRGEQESEPSNIDSFEISDSNIFYTDFSEYTLNEKPHDWKAFGSSGSFVVENYTGATGGKVLVNNSTGRGLIWFTPGRLEDKEIELRCLLQDYGSSTRLRAMGRARDGGSTQYYLSELTSSNRLQKWKFVNGSASHIDTFNFTIPAGQWIRIKFRMEGTSLKAKVWLDSNEEPAGWSMENTDVSLVKDFAGIWSTNNNSALPNVIDWFKVTKL